MQANAYSPYALKDLHQAIDLIDRKISYCNTWETFDSQEARDSHLRKLSTKRAALVKSALALAALGVRCDPQFLPRSFIHPVGEAESGAVESGAAQTLVAAEVKSEKPPRPSRKRR
jgi:hypothetical protein